MQRFTSLPLVAFILVATSERADAHVKWFSEYDWSVTPLTVPELMTPIFWAMFVLTIVTLALFVLGDRWAEKSPWLKALSDWFEARSESGLLVMRIAAFATLLVAWQQGTLLTPELTVESIWVERFQFLVIMLLLFPQTTMLAGIGLLCIWAVGAQKFGLFHMLDYINVIGVGYFLIVRPLKSDWLKATALPVLYASVGLALLWLGSEKLVFPQWALYILEQNPILTLGLPNEFFLTAAAFVEMGLGFMLLICLFSRSLSVTITLVFFLSTMVFGKVEIIGHTLVHASLIVFLFEGPGHTFTPPALLHRKLPMRIAFATVNFTIVLFAILFVYSNAAKYVIPQTTEAHVHSKYEIGNASNPPSLELEVFPDSVGGWNLHVITQNFSFSPNTVGHELVEGQGHAHLYLDGKKIARLYSDWYHLPITQGEHTIRVTLNTDDHQDYTIAGKPIAAEMTLDFEDKEVFSKAQSRKTNLVAKNNASAGNVRICVGANAKR